MLLQLILKSSTLVPRKVRHMLEQHASNRGTVSIQLVVAVEFAKERQVKRAVQVIKLLLVVTSSWVLRLHENL